MTQQIDSKPFAAPMVPSVTKLRDVARDTYDTFTWTLNLPQGISEFQFRPGQFNMLYVFGIGEVPISVSGDPDNKSEIVHTIRAVGSVTNLMAKLQPNDAIGLRGPFGSTWPLDSTRGKDVVLVTGGIGLAPLRPVIYSVLHNRGDYGRLILLHGSRTPQDMLYTQELEQWQKRDDFEAFVTVDIGNESWRGAVGLVTTLFQRVQLDPQKTIGMICGPEIMMRFVIGEFAKRGVTDEYLYVSLERNMQCAIGFCGHCQLGPRFVCMDGPVFRYDKIARFFRLPEA